MLSKLFRFLGRLTGASLTSFAMAAVIFTYSPLLADSFEAKIMPSPTPSESTKYYSPKTTFSEIVSSKPPIEVIRGETEKYGINTRYSVAIPSIEAYANIIDNIDPFNEASYRDALKEGVAHSITSSNPGSGKRIFLFSHSTDSLINVARLNAVFYKLSELREGDKVIIYYHDERYVYVVEEKLIVNPSDTSWLNSSSPEELVLQTCDPPGTTKNRLLIIAKPIKP